MTNGDQRIKTILDGYGIDIASATWEVHGKKVIYHVALERIATKAAITFDPPMWVRMEKDEAVVVVTGRMASKVEWATGEALLNANYKIKGNQSPYVYAMAEKRGKDRVILKLIELHGDVYSEDEAQDFKAEFDSDKAALHLMNQIDAIESAAGIQELMNKQTTKDDLAKMAKALHERLRDYAAERYKMFMKRDKLRQETGRGQTQTSPPPPAASPPPPPPPAAKLPTNATDRRDEDLSRTANKGGGFGSSGEKTADEILEAFSDELRFCHTIQEVQATTDIYKPAIEALTHPDMKLANQIRKERLEEISRIDRAGS